VGRCVCAWWGFARQIALEAPHAAGDAPPLQAWSFWTTHLENSQLAVKWPLGLAARIFDLEAIAGRSFPTTGRSAAFELSTVAI